jgi:anti-anti-sigma factor
VPLPEEAQISLLDDSTACATTQEADMPGAEFEVLSVGSDGQHALVLRGELDLSVVSQLEGAIDAACEGSDRDIVLDLSQLTFIDSAGIRAILAANEHCRKIRRHFAVVPGPSNIQSVFELTGVAEQLPFRRGRGYRPARHAILPRLFRVARRPAADDRTADTG